MARSRKTVTDGASTGRRLRWIALPAWSLTFGAALLVSIALTPPLKAGEPPPITAKPAVLEDIKIRMQEALRRAFVTVAEAERSSPEIAATMYRRALSDFDFVITNDPDGSSAAE
jgi:hypothetical protein